MPEESKKKTQKSRNDPKEQRRPRQRNQAGPPEQKAVKKIEEQKDTQKPDQGPGPEFYKSLKRETDEILKITEEENSKYKKKEIQSNWSKYEIQIESYDEIQEQENLGADYEKLIQAPPSIGGHFQFKHEKSWDVDVGPSPYDKYFEINMDQLFLAISTIPFNERNNIPKQIFNETDLLNINNRATRYKQKYNNETPKLPDIHKKIINAILEDNKENNSSNDSIEKPSLSIDSKEESIVKPNISNVEENQVKLNPEDFLSESKTSQHAKVSEIDDIDDLFKDNIKPVVNENTEINEMLEVVTENIEIKLTEDNIEKALATMTSTSTELTKNPVIESPEDLEKWLDDFLEG